jgi:hypothetical protein
MNISYIVFQHPVAFVLYTFTSAFTGTLSNIVSTFKTEDLNIESLQNVSAHSGHHQEMFLGKYSKP